jgi:NAD(P)-dependent dehydrogenase (short-subunit alcohol dehydrogenase family)
VTGAASGIGEATAIAFAQEGAGVVIVDTDREQGEVVAKKIEEQGGDVLVVPADVARENEVQGMVEDVTARWGRLDILVNNAGIYYQADVVDTPSDVWNDVLAVNLSGAFLCTKYAVPAMIRGGGGAVINVASEAGLVGIKGQVAYNVSKGGMIALTRSCAVDLAGQGVRVNRGSASAQPSGKTRGDCCRHPIPGQQ